MNALQTYIDESGLDWIETMNHLQLNGVISDNCVTVADVCDSDAEKAVQWLKQSKITS